MQAVLVNLEVQRRLADGSGILQNQMLEGTAAVSGDKRRKFVGDGEDPARFSAGIAVVEHTKLFSGDVLLDDGIGPCGANVGAKIFRRGHRPDPFVR